MTRRFGHCDEERLCVCGHDIRWHEDHDFNIHECNYRDCQCQQFRDADEESKGDAK